MHYNTKHKQYIYTILGLIDIYIYIYRIATVIYKNINMLIITSWY
jgi:hypothetical protein